MPANTKNLPLTLSADFLEWGSSLEDAFTCEERSDPDDARSTARTYERIIAAIEQQTRRQGGDA